MPISVGAAVHMGGQCGQLQEDTHRLQSYSMLVDGT
jgi:hypothetical protein